MGAAMLVILAGIEWLRWYTQNSPSPWQYTFIAVAAVVISVFKILGFLEEAKRVKLGGDGEKAVGQYLEQLRESGGKVFHDVVGPEFNIDHVVVHKSAIYVIETKTYSKPEKGPPKIVFDGEKVFIRGKSPDRNPVVQARALSTWLAEVLTESTGRAYLPRPVVVFPGWFIEPACPAFSSWRSQIMRTSKVS